MSKTIDGWLEAQRIKGGSHGFECIGIARMQQVWGAAREDLLQQIVLLRAALDQLLDDMGADGHCVCEAAKQQAIEVFAATKPKP